MKLNTDKRSKLSVEPVYLFFKQIERFLIAEPEPIQLIVGIANNDESVWNQYKRELHYSKIIKTDADIQAY